MQALKINDTTIHFKLEQTDETKPLLVFVNSLGTDFRIWNKLRQELSGHCNMLFHDKRGHGLSALGNAPHKIETYVADLAALIDHLEFKTAVAVGLSIGGLIVQGLYHERPDLVSKMVVCNSAVKIGNHESWNTRITAVTANGLDSITDQVMKLWFSPDFHLNQPAQVNLARTMMARQSVSGYIAACEALRDADYTAKAATIKVPTLFIGGDQDGSTPPALVEASSKMVPGAKFHLIKSCAHIPCVERPHELAHILKQFALGS